MDFTPLSERLSPAEVVGTLDQLFTHFDTLAERHGLEKIKTIGDCVHGRGGRARLRAPITRTRAALLALDMRDAMRDVGRSSATSASSCGSASTPDRSWPA